MAEPRRSRFAVSLDALERSSRVRPEDRTEEVPDPQAPTELHEPLPSSFTHGWRPNG